MQSKAVKIVEGGKLIIPASFRRELGIEVGETVVIELADGELRVRSRKTDLRRIQERVRRIGVRMDARPDGPVSDAIKETASVAADV